MRKVHSTTFVLLCFCLSLFSCREGIVEPVRLLELYVVDSLGIGIPNAKVEFYATEQQLNTNTNKLIETFYSNEEGIVQVALDVDIFDYYVNIEKGELNNWYTTTFISLPELRKKNTTAIMINSTFEAKLTGINKKRWQQTDNIINGNPSFPNCGNQLYHDFIRRTEMAKNSRDGLVERYQGNTCPNPGSSEGINQWIYDPQNNTITFGIGNFAETYQVTEFTEDQLSLVYTTPDGAFRVERRYKLID